MARGTILKRLRRWFKRIVIACLTLFLILTAAYLIYFPGQQAVLAFTLATGFGVHGLQERVDALEDKAINGEPFTDEDKAFLKNLYTCFAKGGRLTIVFWQTGQMMTRYLSMSGEDLYTDPRVFVESRPVLVEAARLTEAIATDYRRDAALKDAYVSPRFNMADPTFPDSIAGLYYGKLTVRPQPTPEGEIALRWRAEVPWVWPTYETVREQYGDYKAREFALPNARSLLWGPRYCLYMDDGLGAHLENLGLAKSFRVYSEWDEVIEPADQNNN